MADATAIVLTRDEEKNIATCIGRIRGFAARIVVVDSGSTDRTREIARGLGADVIEHPFHDYATQFNWAIEHAGIATEWIMRVDADEFWTPELCRELEDLLAEHAHDDVNGVLTESWFYFMGRRVDHGGPKKRKIMIFRRGHGFIEKRRMDEHTILTDGRCLQAKNRFEHHDFKDLNAWIDKMNGYASREADDYFIDREKYRRGAAKLGDTGDQYLTRTRRIKFMFYYRLPKFLRCWMLFVYNYIFRLGILDGKAGFVYHWMYQRWYRTLVDAKILEREMGGEGTGNRKPSPGASAEAGEGGSPQG